MAGRWSGPGYRSFKCGATLATLGHNTSANWATPVGMGIPIGIPMS